MTTLDEFIKAMQASGKPMDYDGAFGGECIDLVKFLLDFCYGIKPGKIGNANELWEDKYGVLKKWGFYRIEGVKDLQKGDIVFLKTAIVFQHVGVFIEEKTKTIIDFDQVGNGDKVGGELPPAYREWDKSLVLGVWRHKNSADPVQKEINDFCEEYKIRKRGNDEYFSCREVLSIFAKLNKKIGPTNQ